jgi:peroxin-1
MSPKAQYIKLTNNTEVIVAPKVRNKDTKTFDESTAINDLQKQQTSPHVCLRALPHSYSKKAFSESLEIYVHPDSAETIKNCDHVRITKVVPAYAQNDKQQHNQQQNGDEKDGETAIPEKAKATYAKLVLDKSIPKNHVYIDEISRVTLGIKTYDLVK